MAEYLVDDLAHAAGTSVRNVRVYQDRGLLPPPRKVGRQGLYGEEHLARLRLIGGLLKRGYTFSTIKEMLDAWRTGRSVGDLLGLDGPSAGPWSAETPRAVAMAHLRRRFGPQMSQATLRRAVAIGLLERSGDELLAPSPRLLDAGADLVALGLSLEQVLDLAQALRAQVEQVARLLFHTVGEHLPEPDPGQPGTEVTVAVGRLRPHAQRAVEAMLALALAREADLLLARFGESIGTQPTGQRPHPREPSRRRG